MIKNEKQKRTTASKLKALRSHLRRLKIKHPRPTDFDFFSIATQRQIDQMEREIELYELAKTGDVDGLVATSNEIFTNASPETLTFGDLIALARLARGLTQQELASKLGVEQAHVARYERHSYSGYSMETLAKILTALGLRLALLQATQDRTDVLESMIPVRARVSNSHLVLDQPSDLLESPVVDLVMDDARDEPHDDRRHLVHSPIDQFWSSVQRGEPGLPANEVIPTLHAATPDSIRGVTQLQGQNSDDRTPQGRGEDQTSDSAVSPQPDGEQTKQPLIHESPGIISFICFWGVAIAAICLLITQAWFPEVALLFGVLIIGIALMTQPLFWLIGGLAAAFSTLACIVSFQIVGALVCFFLMLICWGIAANMSA